MQLIPPELPEKLAPLLACLPAVRVSKLKGDASSRSYYRFSFPDPASAGRLVSSAFALWSRDSERTSESGVSGKDLVVVLLPAECSARLARCIVDISRYLEFCGVPTPTVYLAAYQQGLLIMEDVGEVRLCDFARKVSAERLASSYRLAVDLLLRMQFPEPNVPRDCIAYQYSFTFERFRWELDFFAEHFISGLLRMELSSDEEQIMRRAFDLVSREMLRQPMVFTHRDFHSRNLMVRNDSFFVLDYQDARLGPILYDLASLLGDAYLPLNEATTASLIDYYIQRMPAELRKALQSLGISRSFQVSLIQRSLKAIGTFAYQGFARQNKEYLAFIPAALANAIDAARRNPDLLGLARVLERLSLRLDTVLPRTNEDL